MGIGISLLVVAAGAILRYALTTSVNGIDVHTVGVILMLAGGLGMVLSILFWSSFAPFRRRRTRSSARFEDVVTDGGR